MSESIEMLAQCATQRKKLGFGFLNGSKPKNPGFFGLLSGVHIAVGFRISFGKPIGGFERIWGYRSFPAGYKVSLSRRDGSFIVLSRAYFDL